MFPYVIGLGFDTGPSGAPLAPCLTYATMAVTLLAIIRWRVTHANPNPDSDPNPNQVELPNPLAEAASATQPLEATPTGGGVTGGEVALEEAAARPFLTKRRQLVVVGDVAL